MRDDGDRVIGLSVAQAVARITLNRPERHNAFDSRLVAELAEAFERVAESDDVRVVVLAAAGKSFSAGADVEWLQQFAAQPRDANAAQAMRIAAMFQRLYTLPQPTLAIVQGSAFGGGLGLVAACDLAIASQQARFSLSETRLGLVPAVIGWYVQQAIGARAATRYALTAEVFPAAEALQLGLVHALADTHDALMKTAEEWTGRILGNGPAAVRATKRMLAELRGRACDASLVTDSARRLAEAGAGEEAREGISAFLARRPPAWRR